MQWPMLSVRRLMIMVAVVATGFGGTRLARSQMAIVETDAWVGWSQASIISWMGQPTEIHELDYDLTNEPRPIVAPPGPRRTLCFRTRRGYLWVWLRPAIDGWECYHSLWYREWVRF